MMARPRPVAPPPPAARMTDNHGTGAVPPTIAELSSLVNQLREVMQEEIAALDAYAYDGLAQMTERKRVIAGLLHEKQKVLQKHPDCLKEAPETERGAFEILLAEMKEIGRKNEMAVRVARDANKMLLDAIIRGATKQSQLGSGYGRSGAMTALTTNYGARQPVSLFSNESC